MGTYVATLRAYNYDISYKTGKDQVSADRGLLNSLPLPEAPKEVQVLIQKGGWVATLSTPGSTQKVPILTDTILQMEYLQTLPTTADYDHLLFRVYAVAWLATYR